MKAPLPKSCFHFLAIVLFCWLYMPAGDAVGDEPEIEISPPRIGISSFYHGIDVELRGTVPAGSEVALVLMGEKEEQTFSRKDRVGPLWMNVETVIVKGVPQMYYLLTSTGTVEELAPSRVLMERAIGYMALREAAAIEQQDPDHDATFREFIKLKESMGLYETSYSSIKLKPLDEDFSRFSVSIPIPAMVSPGEYRVSMYCFKEDHSFSNTSSKLTVEKVGLPEELSKLAFNHAALYGILAIVVAVAAGLIMGFLFGKKGNGRH